MQLIGTQGTQRSADPANPSLSLNWYNHVLCANCFQCVELCYSLDKSDKDSAFHGSSNRKIIESIEKDPSLRQIFLARKQHLNKMMLQVLADNRREPTQPVGTAVRMIDLGAVEETQEEFDFYKWNDYQKSDKLGNKTGNVLDGHAEVVFKGERGVAVFRKPKDCIRVRMYKQSGSQVDNVLSSTVNEVEFVDNEIKQVCVFLSPPFVSPVRAARHR